MSRSMNKTERLRAMELLYTQHPYSDIEMAERLGVTRTTVFRDRVELEREVVFIKDEEGRWMIDPARYLSNIRVDLAEALSLYLAARRASQQTRVAHVPVAGALEKLAAALRRPMTERLVQAAAKVLEQKADPQRTTVFETVARAWSEGLELRLRYRALHGDKVRMHRFAPYLLEPSPWTDGVYLIGQSDLAQRVITLKLDRIETAQLLGPFDPPGDFDEGALLRHAWGIWGGEGEPERVRLKFAPGLATRRLRESIWHPSEDMEETSDGGCIWSASIFDWQEMLPWIRGWGPQVKVLEPKALRETLMGEARALAISYGWSVNRSGERAAPSVADTFAALFDTE